MILTPEKKTHVCRDFNQIGFTDHLEYDSKSRSESDALWPRVIVEKMTCVELLPNRLAVTSLI